MGVACFKSLRALGQSSMVSKKTGGYSRSGKDLSKRGCASLFWSVALQWLLAYHLCMTSMTLGRKPTLICLFGGWKKTKNLPQMVCVSLGDLPWYKSIQLSNTNNQVKPTHPTYCILWAFLWLHRFLSVFSMSSNSTRWIHHFWAHKTNPASTSRGPLGNVPGSIDLSESPSRESTPQSGGFVNLVEST